MKKTILVLLVALFTISLVHSQEEPGEKGFRSSEAFKRVMAFGEPFSFRKLKNDKTDDIKIDRLTFFPVALLTYLSNNDCKDGYMYEMYLHRKNDPDAYGDYRPLYLFIAKYDEKAKKWGFLRYADPLRLVEGRNLPYKGKTHLYSYEHYVKYGEPKEIKVSANGVVDGGVIIEAVYVSGDKLIKAKYETYINIYSVNKKGEIVKFLSYLTSEETEVKLKNNKW